MLDVRQATPSEAKANVCTFVDLPAAFEFYDSLDFPCRGVSRTGVIIAPFVFR